MTTGPATGFATSSIRPSTVWLIPVVSALGLGPAVVGGWPVPAVVAVLPFLVVALGIAGSGSGDAADDARARGARLALVAGAAVLPIGPGVLGVSDLVDAGLGAWTWRLSLTLPVVVAIIAVDPGGVRAVFGRPLVWWFAIGGWALVSAPAASSPGTAALAAAELAAVGVMIGWSVGRLTPRDAIGNIALGAALFCAVSVVVDLVDVEMPTIFDMSSSTGLGFPRLVGLAAEPIQLAETGGLAIVCVLAVASTKRLRNLGLLQWSVIAVGLAAVIGSQSRAAIAAVVGAVVWMIVRRRAAPAVAAIVAIVGAAGLILALTGSGPVAFVDLVDLRDDSSGSNGRIDAVWPAAIEHIGERPITGWGITGTETAMRQAMEAGDVPLILARNAHNRFLETALGLGIIGLVLLAALAVELSSVVRSPGLEAILIYLVVVGITGPGSGAAFVSADEVALIGVAAILITARSTMPVRRPGVDTEAYLDAQLFG